MGFFDAITRALTVPSGGISSIFGNGGPQMPSMPSILSSPPTPQPAATMPNVGAPGVLAAGQAAAAAAAARNGRASTILTGKKKKPAPMPGADTPATPGFDTYSGSAL